MCWYFERVDSNLDIDPTRYNRTIAEISEDGKNVTLNNTLRFDHLAFSELNYEIAAGVGLLSRNIRITAQDYDSQLNDLFGSSIYVSTYSKRVGYTIYNYNGFARISNVEFYQPGKNIQFGLSFVDRNEASYVKKSSFHHGLGSTMSLQNSQG